AALDAQPPVIGRTVAPLDEQNLVVLDVVGQLAAHPAVRAHRFDLLVRHGQPHLARRHQGAGRAGLYAFAAADAGGVAHRVIHVKYDFRVVAAEREADHVVHLLVAAGAHAARALDAGIQVDRDSRVRRVAPRLDARRKARLADGQLAGPEIDLVMARVFGFR